MHGFLNVNKPAGPTSHDIVDRVRRAAGRSVKVGHAGTLDPFASGVLVVCLGGACRLADLAMGQEKTYITTIRLGAVSSTDDPTGEITFPTEPVTPPARQVVAEVLEHFVGQISQIPPAHSAALVNGKRAYSIARQGKDPGLAAKTITVHQITMLDYDYPNLRLEIRCGSGTYIRSLARDIGQVLGVGGYCIDLVRTASGNFRLEDAVGPDKLDLPNSIASPLLAVKDWPLVQMTAEQMHEVFLGRSIANEASLPDGQVAMLNDKGELIALGQAGEGCIKPRKVLRDTHHGLL